MWSLSESWSSDSRWFARSVGDRPSLLGRVASWGGLALLGKVTSWGTATSWGLVAVGLASSGCAVIYPELETPISAPASDAEFDPPPPPNLYYIAFAEVEIPPKTRDGRSWDDDGGAPDPYGVVLVGDEELFRTAVARDSFQPTWPETPKRNYMVPRDAIIKVEVWDENPMHSRPVCVKKIKKPAEEARGTGQIDIRCDTGATITLDFAPAKARWGIGMFYELRADGPAVTRVLLHSPATRAGLKGGEEIVSINGKKTAGLDEKKVRSLINSSIKSGLDLEIRTGGSTKKVRLEEGPIYSLHGD